MSTEIVSYEDKLAALAQKATAVEKPSSSTIGTRAGVLTYGGQAVAGNKLDVIVIASTHANLFYEGDFNPDAIVNPVCYAYGEDEASMVPHPSASKPQHDNCKDCPQNQWGSASRGRGKACKNSRHLALIGADVKDIDTAEIAVLKLPVTSVANWSNYVNKLATLFNRPPLGMFTQIGTQPDAKSQFKITFLNISPVSNDLLDSLIARSTTVLKTLERVYDANPESVADDKPAKNKKF